MEHALTASQRLVCSERLAYSPAEAAILLGLSRSKVYQLMADGTLTSSKIQGSRRITRDALLSLLDRCEEK